ncbi:MAG: thiamine pyrophosphate-binding protein [Candidatus Rokubacteria bacterium]|nr:thiamine pyrophosphate-binding protein [Candidatus Rokubacteria bacterium]
MSAGFVWPKVSANPGLDLMHSDAMGKISSVGLGLALALPDRRVIVLDGDGSLLMNLGTLVTIAHMAPRNLLHFVLGNDTYLTSGSQSIPNAGRIDFAGLAAAAGYAGAHRFEDGESLGRDLAAITAQPGPTFVYLKVGPAWTASRARNTPARAMLSRFRAALWEAYRRMRPPATGAVGSSDDRALAARIEKLRARESSGGAGGCGP